MSSFKTATLYVCVIAIHAAAQETRPENKEQNWAALHDTGAAEFDSNRYVEALATFERCLPLAATPEQRAMTLGDIGYSLSGLGRNIEAALKLEQALAAWRSIDPAGPRAAGTAVNLANVQRTIKRYADAERTLRAALDAKPRDDASLARVLNILGDLMNQESRFTEARENFEAALRPSPGAGGRICCEARLTQSGNSFAAAARGESIVHGISEEDRLKALIGLGEVDRAVLEWQPALANWNEALTLSRKIGRADMEAIALRGLGDCYVGMGDPARAEPLLRRALAILERMPVFAPQYAAALVSIGVAYGQEGKRRLAEDAFRGALNLNNGLPDANPSSTLALRYLAALLAVEKRFDEAVELATRANRILQTAFGENSAPAAASMGTMAFVEEQAGDLNNAEHHYSEALRIMRENKILNSDTALGLMDRYAIVLRRLHRRRDARAIEAQAKAFCQAAQPGR